MALSLLCVWQPQAVIWGSWHGPGFSWLPQAESPESQKQCSQEWAP